MIDNAEDLVKVDDTWLKVAKLMFENFRGDYQNERISSFKKKEVEDYVK